MVEPGNKQISIGRQCDLIGLPRSSLYYESQYNEYNQLLMRLIDEEYLRHPFYGILKLTAWLRSEGHMVNHKRVARMMNLMGIEAIYPKPKLSKSNQEDKKYPYLLRGYNVNRSDEVWSSDITYIRMKHGFIYLVAVIDWYSRYVLSWEISITLELDFCIDALENALLMGTPKIFNTDQGSQFTSNAWTSILESRGIAISMDSRGRALDNIFIERLWRSLKYEEVYLNDYQSVKEARRGINSYMDFYNNKRFHQSLNYKSPADIRNIHLLGPKAPTSTTDPVHAYPTNCALPSAKTIQHLSKPNGGDK